MYNRQKNVVLVVACGALAVAAIYFYSTRHSREIAYHRQKYLAFEQEYQTNYDVIIADEQRRSAFMQSWNRESIELKRLGYLVDKDIPFDRDWSQEFEQAVADASFQDPDLWTYQLRLNVTNEPKVIRVTATPADLVVWERLVSVYASKTNRSQ